jgi:hypothetical protein
MTGSKDLSVIFTVWRKSPEKVLCAFSPLGWRAGRGGKHGIFGSTTHKWPAKFGGCDDIPLVAANECVCADFDKPLLAARDELSGEAQAVIASEPEKMRKAQIVRT